MLIFNWICLVIIAIFSNATTFMDPMILSVMYVWCQLNKDTTVSFWFGTQFKVKENLIKFCLKIRFKSN
jgi:Derlin-1